MFKTIEDILIEFRLCFSREKTWRWFVIIVIGFILRSDHLGVTSIIRVFLLDASLYETILHFFHSDAWELASLRKTWYRLIFKLPFTLKLENRHILVGDGVKVSKEAYYMPAVKKLLQESEDSSKPQFIFGHMFGAIGILIGNKDKRFCLPLKINIQDGLKGMSRWMDSMALGKSHVEQMIDNAFEVAMCIGNCFLLLDRYFLSSLALKRQEELNGDERRVEIITKAKSNCIAYKAPPKKTKRKGRPRKRGSSVKLNSLFRKTSQFSKTTIIIYGKEKNVSYYCTNLLWGLGYYRELRFVLVEYDGQRSILVSTDLTLSPERIIELYAYRFGIESMFREFKQQLKGFNYHFWSKYVPRLNHFAKKDNRDPLSDIDDEDIQKKILAKIKAIEGYVFFSSVAMGITQILALQSNIDVRDIRYMRTYSKETPSEGSIIWYLKNKIYWAFQNNADSFITRFIIDAQRANSS